MSTKKKILITHSEIPRSALEVLNGYELVFCSELPRPSRKQLLTDIKGVSAIFWWCHENLDKELVAAAGDQLQVVACMSVGYDNIDVPLLQSLNIKASNTPNVLTNSVSEVAMGLLLSTARRLTEGYKVILRDEWRHNTNRPKWMCGYGLDGSTVGIIGLGRIGFTIAKRVKAFDVSRILYTARSEKKEGKQLCAEYVTLDTLLSESDFVILTCALTTETKHLINKEKLEKMKPSCILVNISRGDVIQQDDLVEALRDNVIAGAGLDVMTPEPLPCDHALTKLDNCVLSPHLGSATHRVRHAMAELAAQNIFNALNNIPLVTPIW